MARHSDITRRILTLTLTLLIGLLVLQALGYGIGFVIDPESGAGEFATEAPSVVDDLTITLVRLAGVGMLGFAALMVLSAILVWRRNPAGIYVAMILGGIYIAVGLSALRAGWRWDAGFYGGTGVALIVLSGAVGWLQGRSSEGPRATRAPG
ncbi:MAG: hypothetical protein OEU54_11940 [Gemmatimonadota bacterium]|nr:hypothetical protein [Gemmatimonadota bacterium]